MYAKDAIADTTHLTTEEFGAYFRLLLQAWIGPKDCAQGYLPDNDDKLRRLTGLTIRRWVSVRDNVLGMFERAEDGTIFHKRLLEERDKQREIAEKRSHAGRVSADSRATSVEHVLSKSDTSAKQNSTLHIASASASAEGARGDRTEDGPARQARPLSPQQFRVKTAQDLFLSRGVDPPDGRTLAKWLSDYDAAELVAVVEDLEGSQKLFTLGSGLVPYIFGCLKSRAKEMAAK